jgi:hypothetical protein
MGRYRKQLRMHTGADNVCCESVPYLNTLVQLEECLGAVQQHTAGGPIQTPHEQLHDGC